MVSTSNELVYSPFSKAIFDDPYPVYRRLRDEAPVYRDPDDRWWVLSRFDDVAGALRDWPTYSSKLGPAPENPDDDGRKYSVISMDPPRHDRIRGVLKGFFTPKAVAAMEGALQAVVNHHLDRLRPGTTVDAMEAFAFSIPTDVIGDLLGVPQADREQLRVWWEAFLTRHEGEVAMPATAIEANRNISAYIGDLIEERRERPGDDLISIVLNATFDDPEAGGERSLTAHEVLMFANLLSAAGSETTQKLISNGLVALYDHPDQWQRIVNDHSLIPAAVNEALRYDTPSHWVARTLTEPVEKHGVTMAAGDWVLLLLGSANRDERRYEDPDRFIIDRPRGTDVYFGWGIHICLGQWLARREAQLVFEYIAKKFPNYSVGAHERVLTATVRGYTSVEMTLK
ncbi:cytochrome [Mycolicibacterium moriokaense]|jgi:cytochrome P450|uniref:Steroid C26-monooxygenase n=1 Tax=Mycolicibacterium moriokaense TaxID=39691 RepID=A0AAD1HA35_9MYCO|nr:cytochrome P450 [Mycolicibacterium moriokaense]MCV7042998.1 cytochrome P450 [Mycolicibacterium moriokaense]ORB17970.1 cytochrome [Mycolicibacterium moriokaense]BBX00995.1 cytochrome P450 [Mycolicibacterium moriokaense]